MPVVAPPPEAPVVSASVAVPAKVEVAPPSEARTTDGLMNLFDAERVGYAVGSSDSFYVETDKRWLCLRVRDGAVPRCWRWPTALSRVTDVELQNDPNGVVQGLHVEAEDMAFDLDATWSASDVPSLTVKKARPIAPGFGRRAVGDPPFELPGFPARKLVPSQASARPPGDPPLESMSLVADEDAHALTLARAIGASGPLMLGAAERGGSSLLSITISNKPPFPLDGSEHTWTCQRLVGAPRFCAETQLASFEAFHPDRSLPGGWLVLVTQSDPGRHATVWSELVWVTVHEGSLTTAGLPIGSQAGVGSHCDHYDSYCVSFEGILTPFDLLSPTCVRLGRTTLWTALHVRVPDLWLDKTRKLAPRTFDPAPGTYHATPDGWAVMPCSADKP